MQWSFDIKIKDLAEVLAESPISETQRATTLMDSMRIKVTMDDIQNELQTPYGIQFMLWLSMRKHHTDLTFDAVGTMCEFDMDLMNELMAAIMPEEDDSKKKDLDGTAK